MIKIKKESNNYNYSTVSEGQILEGLKILSDIPNLNSISSSFNSGEYKIRSGLKKVPVSDFDAKPTELFYASNDIRRCKILAEEIKESKQIKPLIVVIDEKGPYILEGAHRLGALYLLKVRYFPALVIDDLSD